VGLLGSLALVAWSCEGGLEPGPDAGDEPDAVDADGADEVADLAADAGGDPGVDADDTPDSGADDPLDDGADDAVADIDWGALHGRVPQVARPAPEFEALNRDGSPRGRGDLVGQPTVLWFYPKAATSG